MMESDLISRSAVIDIIDEERRFIESLRETAYDNEDRAHNTGELGCAIRLARKIKGLSTIDAVPVVHEKDIRSSVITVKDSDGWQDRIILADESRQVCAVYYADDSERVPVVHARWIYSGDMDSDGNSQGYCSRCGAGDKHRADLKNFVPYCWKCGARMDSESEEDTNGYQSD